MKCFDITVLIAVILKTYSNHLQTFLSKKKNSTVLCTSLCYRPSEIGCAQRMCGHMTTTMYCYLDIGAGSNYSLAQFTWLSPYLSASSSHGAKHYTKSFSYFPTKTQFRRTFFPLLEIEAECCNNTNLHCGWSDWYSYRINYSFKVFIYSPSSV